ncbi:hypothetical protein SAMN05421846_106120 [Chryseobacterium taeanense]|uniref:Uncharacterized protein n=1 Tax=Chryseobacterium taeanense TaxID=311334 RepID=A0A1G8JLN5_9FLAO|nr:hypothetical protein [Chryseobacterium taeanense]SDI32105.1 hypothetical protein SAMN05421846_106120 [Chryseobacterium taeanense]
MMKCYEPFPLLRFCVVWLYIFIPSKAYSGSFVPADSIIFVAEDSYVYSETSVFIAGSEQNKDFTSAKKSGGFLTRSSLPFSTQKSVNIAAHKVCYTGSLWNRNDPGRISRTSMLGIMGGSSVKLHDKIIKSLFLAFVVIGRDRKQLTNGAFYPFQIRNIIINHFVRPPPVIPSEGTKVLAHKSYKR